MTRDYIKVEIEGPVGSLVFNRPQVLNAFHNEAMDECRAALHELAEDERVRVVLIRGEGRAFSAGFDMKASAERDMSTVDHVRRQMERQFDFIMAFWDCPKPTIALVHGFCMAGAFEVALACDITVAAEGTRFGEPEVRFGTGIVAMLLPWAVLPKHAKEMLLTGNDKMDANRAHAIGIVNHVVPGEELLPFGRRMALDIAAAAGPSVLFTKRAMNRTYEIMGMRDALKASLDIDVILNATPSAEKVEFQRLRKEQGLKAALAWRDARFSDGKSD
ncbi:enoyl-CoA hydratase/isomerase family protein [Reyranella sp.]|uniref:enoyl-CoA hydratase/isomerase family protein n=1 Tax=Reyranella sp. TaxID=1929291 RepID=UPI003782FBBB